MKTFDFGVGIGIISDMPIPTPESKVIIIQISDNGDAVGVWKTLDVKLA